MQRTSAESATAAGGARRGGAGLLIGVSSVVAGLSGYLVVWMVASAAGPARYAAFAVFWSALYFAIGTLAGVQQEITRATFVKERSVPPVANPARNYAFVASALVLFVFAGTGLVWGPLLFGSDGVAWMLAMACGASGYVIVAVLAGTLYGLSFWYGVAALILVDSTLRLLTTAIALAFDLDLVAVAWAVGAPFFLTPLLLWPILRRRVVGRTTLDVGYRRLTGNIAHTLVAAGATSLIVSGFPLLVGMTASDTNAADFGVLVLAVTLTRAPLVVPMMSLQSLLVISFRDARTSIIPRVAAYIGFVVAGAIAFAGAAWLLGGWAFEFALGPAYRIDSGLLGLLVLSAAGIGALCVSGPAVLSRGAHAAYSAGWVTAAVVTVLLLLLPYDLTTRVLLALYVGPAAGVAVHTVALALSARESRPRGEPRVLES